MTEPTKEELLARLHGLNPGAVILDAAANEATAEKLLANPKPLKHSA